MDNELINALRQLDPANDEHWTDDGAPALEPVRIALGRVVQRKEVTTVAPELTRDTFAAWLEALDNPGGADQQTEGGDDEQINPAQAAADDLFARRARLEAQEGELATQIKALNEERNAVVAELDAVIKEIEEEDLRVNPMARVKDHIQRQKEERLRRVTGDVGPSVLDKTLALRPKQQAYVQGATVKPAASA